MSPVPPRVLPFTLPGTTHQEPFVSWALGSECKARHLGPRRRAHPVVSVGFQDLVPCRADEPAHLGNAWPPRALGPSTGRGH